MQYFYHTTIKIAYNSAMNKKERLYISDLLDDPVVLYPSYYLLSKSSSSNEILRSTLEAIHMFAFEQYSVAKDSDDIFSILDSSQFAIFKEYYAVGYFGGRVMYLEANGWKSMPMTKDAFLMENWLIPL